MEHPITPPTELVAQWLKQFYGPATRLGTLAPGEASLHVAAAAAQWGADQELDACAKWLDFYSAASTARGLRAARRPKPPSLKEQALKALNQADEGLNESEWQQRSNTIRRALEALPND